MINIHTCEDGSLLIELSGSLDVSGALKIEPQMKAAATAGNADMGVDLSALTFVSSQGIRVLVATAKILSIHGRKMALIAPRPDVRKVLLIMGIDKIIPLVDDRAAAADFFAGL